MSDYDITSTVSAGDWGALLTEANEALTLRHEVQTDAPGHGFSHNTTSYATITSDSIASIEADDIIIAHGVVNCSCSSSSDKWTFIIDFGSGSATSAPFQKVFHATSSNGDTDIVHLFGVFKDQSAGTHTIALQVKATSSPAGILHVDTAQLNTFTLKQRA